MAPARNATGTNPQPHSNQGLIRSQLTRPLYAVVLAIDYKLQPHLGGPMY